MIRRIMAFLISLLLILNSTLTNAFAIRQWGVNNPMAVGASILYDGLKGAVKSSVLITPNATQVAKVLSSGGAGLALNLAVDQILGAVDWILDPANNQITYIDHTNNNSSEAIWSSSPIINIKSITNSSAEIVLNQYCISYGGGRYLDKSTIKYSNNNTLVYAYCRTNTSTYTGSVNAYITTNTKKHLPLETVAQQVIENAQNDNLDAQFAVLAAANSILSEAEKDAAKAEPIEKELERNSKSNCNKAIKLLEQVDRLSRKLNKTIPAKRLQEWREKIASGTITSNDLPAEIQSDFPSEFKGMTLNQIRSLCGKAK